MLAACYVSLSRRVGIRVHGVLMPSMDFENQRLTPSSFQSLEEDRGDFEEVDVSRAIAAFLAGEDPSRESEVRTVGFQDRGADDESHPEPWGHGSDADSQRGPGQPETAPDLGTPSSDVPPALEADSASSAAADSVRTPYGSDVPVGRILHTRL